MPALTHTISSKAKKQLAMADWAVRLILEVKHVGTILFERRLATKLAYNHTFSDLKKHEIAILYSFKPVQ